MPHVTVIAAAFEYYPILAHAMLCQTHKDWTLICFHDGPNDQYKKWINAIADERIQLHCTPARINDYGHSLREMALRTLVPSHSEFVVVSNMDNYYVPEFLARMLVAVQGHAAAYCNCLHSHHGWQPMNTALEVMRIDGGCVMVKKELAVTVGWPSRLFHADWIWIEEMLKMNRDWVHVATPMLIHN